MDIIFKSRSKNKIKSLVPQIYLKATKKKKKKNKKKKNKKKKIKIKKFQQKIWK